jgi:hypothetical protein
MTELPQSKHGQDLWRLLPSVYRERDQEFGDLARYLDSMGELLDQIYATLVQRRADALPYECQPWLLPYFADLLDVHLVSPDTSSQRREVAFAIDWRKRKGTLEACVEIAQAMGFRCVVPQEGHLRVARTPHVAAQIATLRELGEPAGPSKPPQHPPTASRRPGLPAAMVDFRTDRQCHAIPVAATNAMGRETDFGKVSLHWRQQNPPYGVPVLWAAHSQESLSYQDMTVRTVDTRTPTWKHGHHHPKRLLLYVPLPTGFALDKDRRLGWPLVQNLCLGMDTPPRPAEWEQTNQGRYCRRVVGSDGLTMIEQRLVEGKGDKLSLRTRRYVLPLKPDQADAFKEYLSSWSQSLPAQAFILCITSEPNPYGGKHLTVAGGAWNAERAHAALTPPEESVIKRLGIERFFEKPEPALDYGCQVASMAVSSSALDTLRLQDVVTTGELQIRGYGSVELARCSIQKLQLTSGHNAARVGLPNLSARDSLIARIVPGLGLPELCRFEYCTLLQPMPCKAIQASDCIFASGIGTPSQAQIRYSCIPKLGESIPSTWRLCPKTRANCQVPHFHPSYALHPATDDAIRFGAEDGGELGAFHHRKYCLHERSVIQKLRDFVPAGIEPVLVFDPTWEPPQRVATIQPTKKRKP